MKFGSQINGLQNASFLQTRPITADRAIYPTNQRYYVILLIIHKAILALVFFISYDILKVIHVVQFLFITKALSSIFLVLIQKPFTSGKKLSKNQWFHVVQHAVGNSFIALLWLFGLSLCGPVRTILMFHHREFVVIFAISAIITGAGGHSKLRGAFCFIAGIFGLLFLDHDDLLVAPTEHPEGLQHHGLSHVFYYIISWLGLADHKGGVLLLLVALLLQVAFSAMSRRLSFDIGGAKRLNAFSALVSSVILAPWAFFLRMNQELPGMAWSGLLLPTLFVSLLLFVTDYYVEATTSVKLEAPPSARIGTLTIALVAIVLSWLRGHDSFIDFGNRGHTQQQDHILSGGLIFSYITFSLATIILTSPASKSSGGNFIGYNAQGLPLYSAKNSGEPGYSLLSVIKSSLRQVMEEPDSRKIFYFLCLNLAYTFVEIIYGFWTNSLGLISDGFHMLFDCSSLVLGLYAAVLARRAPTKTFPFGYGRVEILSGFINGLLLVAISVMVFTNALGRLFSPPEIKTEKLITVSIAGLCVNLIGIFVFRHAHFGGKSHSHSHGGHHHSHNTNIQGVFLHILADTLGSVGVIISSLLIEQFGLLIADPICSLFIACLIFLSVIPLLKQSSQILTLRSPLNLDERIRSALNKVKSISGVISYSNQHFWQYSSNVLVGTVNVQIQNQASEQKIIGQVTGVFKELGISYIAVQVEKEEFFAHQQALEPNDSLLYSRSKNNYSSRPDGLLEVKTI